jgi:leader peptidase (prepilin peptidase)/N-methyltransferase
MPPSTALWTIWFVATIVYGLSIGSFLNVVIYRLPLGQSVSSPTWSYCPNCKHRLGGADLIPLLSFLLLGRKCRYCGKPISWRYFGVEALTGLLFALVYLRTGPGLDCVFGALFVSVLVPAFFIDLEHFIIPDELCALGFGLGVAYNIYEISLGRAEQWMRLWPSAVRIPSSIGGAIVCALIFHLISFAGLIYYSRSSKKSGKSLGSSIASFWLGIADDYAYLWLKFLGFGLWLAPARRFIAVREAAIAEEMSPSSETVDPSKTRREIAEEIESDEEQTGMGQGDAKLAAVIGAFLFVKLSLIAFFIAILTGTVVGVGLMVSKGRGGKTAIPFGPYLVIGAVASLLVGQQILDWYLSYAFPAAGK